MSIRRVPHFLTLADLSASQIKRLVQHAHTLKRTFSPLLQPISNNEQRKWPPQSQSLQNKTLALLFSKRSTRTRVASESSIALLGGHPLFLGKDDIQLGVNESRRDSARIIGGMSDGIFARVGAHDEIEELAKYSPVPVANALSDLWHPTQILATFLTLYEHFTPSSSNTLNDLPPLTLTWLGDSTNVLHDLLVAAPRLGHKVRVATPPHKNYQCPEPVWARVKELGCDQNGGIEWMADPKEAVKGADVVVTDTWISMGQEAEKIQRLKHFEGYQVTEKLCAEGGAKDKWLFMHCLPRKQEEVDDEVFYGPRSLAYQEADNRKWTIMALFDTLFARWHLMEDGKSV